MKVLNRPAQPRSGYHSRLLLQACLLAAVLAVNSINIGFAAETKPSQFVSERLSVETIGAGPELILLAGFACSVEIWRPLATQLSGIYRIHLVQPAGFAGKPWTHADGEFIQPLAGEVARYIQEQQLKAPAMIGHSLGGTVALVIAQKHPELLGRIMTVDTLPYFASVFGAAAPELIRAQSQKMAEMLLTADEAGFRAWQSQNASTLTKNSEARRAIVDWALHSDRHALASGIRDIMTLDLRPDLATIKVPVWAVFAAEDKNGTKTGQQDTLWQREYAPVPKLKLIRVDDCRHFIMADQPKKLDAIISDFLRQ